MADSTVKIYGFVNDTAFYNRNFDPSSTTGDIDQGACCYVDKVSQMFSVPAFIRDTRAHRVTMPEIAKINTTWTGDDQKELRELMVSDHSYLNGAMSLVYDSSKLTDEVIWSLNNNQEQMEALFSFLEIAGHYCQFNGTSATTSKMSLTGLDLTPVESMAAPYKVLAGNAVIDQDLTTESKFTEIEKTCGIQIIDGTRTEFNVRRLVRRWIVVNYEGVAENGSKIPIELHLWWDRDSFISMYPLCTITDVVFPCAPECLYELLDNYKSVSAFATASSHYRSTEMDKVVAKNDHTGVYTFTTDYYAYPDTQPSNTFKLSFSCVYKGHAPTIEEVKTRLRAEVLAILPAHSEGEWRKKLPGIIADRQFFIIPLYDNIWNTYDETGAITKTHRWGIYDLTIFSNLIRQVLGTSYLAYQQYVQVIAPKYQQYPVMTVPHSGNPTTNMLVSTLYPDYIGLESGVEDPVDGNITQESSNTQDFETKFHDSLANAASNTNVVEIADFPGMYWTQFNPIDGTTYYILAKRSYPAR